MNGDRREDSIKYHYRTSPVLHENLTLTSSLVMVTLVDARDKSVKPIISMMNHSESMSTISIHNCGTDPLQHLCCINQIVYVCMSITCTLKNYYYFFHR